MRYFAGCERRTFAKAVFQLVPPNDPTLETTIRAFLLKNDFSVKLKKRGAVGLYELRVYDHDAINAAKHANKLIVTLAFKLNYEQREHRLLIWERAEPFTPLE